jgi:nucleotide-binding universal stress UspA family protein
LTIKDILLHLDSAEATQSAKDFAASLAEQTGAHLTAGGVVIDYPPPASELASFAPDWSFGNIEVLSKLAEMRRQAIETAYESFSAAVPAGVSSELVVIQSFQEQACDDFARLARHFDFTVISQGDPEAGMDSRMLLSSALFRSGRPVFVVPAAHRGPAKIDHAMVCWDGGMQAAKALAESLPLLARARKVEVVCVTGASESRKALPGFDITRHLARHRIDATLRELPTSHDAGSALIAYARESAADVLVMGGYGHWRLSELILGGATRSLLAAPPTPLFMAH